MLTGLVEELLIEALHVGYDARMEWAKTPLFNLVGEFIVEISQQENMDSLLIRDIEELTESDMVWTNWRN